MNSRQGFTLLELLIVCAIAGILFGVAIPSFHEFIQRNQATVAINRVIGAVNFARMESVTRRKTITLCPADGIETCGRHWQNGILIFVDYNSNGKFNTDDELIRMTPALPEGSSLSWSSFGSDYYLRFSPLGFTQHQNGTFKYCPPDKNVYFAKLAVLNKAGRVRPSSDTDRNGILNLANGKDVSCI